MGGLSLEIGKDLERLYTGFLFPERAAFPACLDLTASGNCLGPGA